MPIDRSRLTTEKRNPRSRDIDRRSTLEIVDIISAEDRTVATRVARERKRIAAAVEVIVEGFRRGGRLFYVGAGTSGRLGVLDAAECPPTFGTEPRRVQGLIAGGRRALTTAVEGAEDSTEAGAASIDRKRLKPHDIVVGIAACGITPFVRGALGRAKQVGARTILLTCARQARRCAQADIVINPVVGPEVVTGSTRMKAGTATKLVLNTLTTASMIRLGKVYSNLMVDLRATNEKLRDRAERIVSAVTGLPRFRARDLLAQAGGMAKVAIVMHFRRASATDARRVLRECDGALRRAIEKDRARRR